jgi:acyl-CoA dehydrogenase
MGYVEETGAAQFWRDVRVTAIYEGTNGLQAMDLIGRKLSDGGAAVRALLAELDDTPATRALAQATDRMLAAAPNDRFAGAVPYLRAFALTLGSHYLARAAAVEPARAGLAAFHARTFLPEVVALCEAASIGADAAYAAAPAP